MTEEKTCGYCKHFAQGDNCSFCAHVNATKEQSEYRYYSDSCTKFDKGIHQSWLEYMEQKHRDVMAKLKQTKDVI